MSKNLNEELNTARTSQEFDPSMFELVNKDNTKIHDQKFETKATTFAKDAVKRFAKNKSSVVGAVIIALLLLGSFLSLFSPHDIKTANTDEALLPAKLFKPGTGWWDGTLEYTDVPYDEENETPYGYNGEYVYNMTFTKESAYIDQYYSYAKGGYFRPTAKLAFSDASKVKEYYMRSNTLFNISADENFVLKLYLGDENYIADGELCDSYRVVVREFANNNANKQDYEIAASKSTFEDVEINISDYMTAHSIDTLNDCQIFIYFTPKVNPDLYSYLLVKQIILSSETTDADKLALLEEISITDANYTAGLGPNEGGQFPVGYWASTCIPNVYHAVYSAVSFRYDEYGEIFGDRKDFVIGGSIMNSYINNGWCEFTDFDDITTFKVLDADKCPVKEVLSSSYSVAADIYQFSTVTTYWKYKGYSKAPNYIFGTDNLGHDLLTVALSSLKNSLLVAIIATAICLVIGLIWGSISGYFGGNVDIIMERITDILGGIPWIVMMTLVILLLGNNIVTFGIALVLTGWIGTASRTRTQFYRFKGREYILASRTLGASDARLIFRHILPNGLGTIVTGSVLMIPSCIFSEATISYLGLGLQGVDSFGVLLSSNQMYLSTRPLLVIIPSIIISLLMISFNLFGNGLRDALNPTLKGGEQ